MMAKSKMANILDTHEEELLEEWMREQLDSDTLRADLVSESTLRQQSAEFLGALRQAAQSGNLTNIMSPEWGEVREILTSHPLGDCHVCLLPKAAAISTLAPGTRAGCRYAGQ